MATYLIDLDGVFFKHSTMIPNPGALDLVERLRRDGHDLVFVTARTSPNDNAPHLDIRDTEQVLKQLGVSYSALIGGASSPRIIVDDSGAGAVNHRRNTALTLAAVWSETPHGRVEQSLLGAVWATCEYGQGDADDIAQTICLAESLVYAAGFDRRDFVRRLRNPGGQLMERLIEQYRGGRNQWSKLLASDDPDFLATDGITCGAAMRAMPVAAFHLHDTPALVRASDQMARVTHREPEARLAALLLSLRYRQAFIGREDPKGLVDELSQQGAGLGFPDSRLTFFLGVCQRAAALAAAITDSDQLLIELLRAVGASQAAWSVPVTACFWAYRADDRAFEQARANAKISHKSGATFLQIGEAQVTPLDLDPAVASEYARHLESIGCTSELQSRVGERHIRHDADTLFFLAISLAAAREGLGYRTAEARALADSLELPEAGAWAARLLGPSRSSNFQRSPSEVT